VSGVRVWLDRVPMHDAYALYVTRRGLGDSGDVLRSDGEWQEYLYTVPVTPTLQVPGLVWREMKPELIKALGALPPAASEAEAKVLREWLAVERARVDRAFDR